MKKKEKLDFTDVMMYIFSIIVFAIGVCILVLSLYNFKVFWDFIIVGKYVKALFCAIGEVIFVPIGGFTTLAGVLLVYQK